MSNLVRWDPFSDIRHTMRLFDESFARPRRWAPAETNAGVHFAVEVSESDSDVEVKAALPGISPENVDITVENDVLTIRGEHKAETEDKQKDYYRRELRYGTFRRAMTLPVSVDTDKAEASFENGMLHLRLPKAEALRAKQIKIGATNGATEGASHDGGAS